VAAVRGNPPYVTRTNLEVGSTVLAYDMGRQPTVTFTWPDEQGAVIARVSAIVEEGSGPAPVTAPRSSWAVFRLLDRAEIEARNEREFRISWTLERSGEYAVRVPYVLRARTTINPFPPGFFALSLPPRLTP
jgi:type VI protein secretion system component VasK